MPFMKRRFRNFRGLGWSWWRAYADRRSVPRILISDSYVSASASVGDPVGTISVISGQGVYTLTLTDDAGGLFALDGAALEVAGALSASVQNVTVEADNGDDDPVSRTFTITVGV